MIKFGLEVCNRTIGIDTGKRSFTLPALVKLDGEFEGGPEAARGAEGTGIVMNLYLWPFESQVVSCGGGWHVVRVYKNSSHLTVAARG